MALNRCHTNFAYAIMVCAGRYMGLGKAIIEALIVSCSMCAKKKQEKCTGAVCVDMCHCVCTAVIVYTCVREVFHIQALIVSVTGCVYYCCTLLQFVSSYS